jgi:hypothetical protein
METSFTFNANGIFELKSANTFKLFLMITNRLKMPYENFCYRKNL